MAHFLFMLMKPLPMIRKIYLLSLLGLLAFFTACQTDDDIVNGEIKVELKSGDSYTYGFGLDDASSEVLTIAAAQHASSSGIRRASDNEIEYFYVADPNYTGEDYAEFTICDRSGSSSCRSSTMRIYISITP